MSTKKKAARPRKKKKVSRRRRDYLLPSEVERLLKAALRGGRHAHRNYTLILLCFRHGLRANELMELRWRNVDLKRKVLRVNRIMNSISSVHPLLGPELLALRKLKREYPDGSHLFYSNRGKKLGGRTISRVISEAGIEAGFKYHVNSLMLRRGCGYALGKAGHNMVSLQHYLGHRNIRHTQRYVELPPNPFKNFWKK